MKNILPIFLLPYEYMCFIAKRLYPISIVLLYFTFLLNNHVSLMTYKHYSKNSNLFSFLFYCLTYMESCLLYHFIFCIILARKIRRSREDEMDTMFDLAKSKLCMEFIFNAWIQSKSKMCIRLKIAWFYVKNKAWIPKMDRLL